MVFLKFWHLFLESFFAKSTLQLWYYIFHSITKSLYPLENYLSIVTINFVYIIEV
jgi:hypothetical protein